MIFSAKFGRRWHKVTLLAGHGKFVGHEDDLWQVEVEGKDEVARLAATPRNALIK